jgi:hypothetical protein
MLFARRGMPAISNSIVLVSGRGSDAGTSFSQGGHQVSSQKEKTQKEEEKEVGGFMRKFLTITGLTALLLFLPFAVSLQAQEPSSFGGTFTYGVWLQEGHRATTAEAVGVDVVVMSDDSARGRIVSRTSYLGAASDSAEVQGFFEVFMYQRFLPLGRSVDIYAQSGIGGFNEIVLNGADKRYVLGVFELGINIWSVVSAGVGGNVIFKDNNQYNVYAKLDLMAVP